MATAVQLNAMATVINGQGLYTNGSMVQSIAQYQQQTPIVLLGNVYTNAVLDSNVGNVIVPVLNTISSSLTQAQFLLDLYPTGITPTSTASVGSYGNAMASVSKTLDNQATGPFSHGMAGFANVLGTAQSFATSSFDITSSINLLSGKTYGDSGLGYGGLNDLITGGIGGNASILASTVRTWGTMYDITNINLIADPYVFGQNLLNQGFGKYGNLSAKLSAAGLDPTNITAIPSVTTQTTTTQGNVIAQTPVGQVSYSTITTVSSTNTVTANSPTVLLNIYQSITGTDLDAIISATGFIKVNEKTTTLADFLNFNTVINPALLPTLSSMGIDSFPTFTTYLHSRVGQATFTSWSSLANFLASSVSTPQLSFTNTTSSNLVLNTSTASTLLSSYGTGSGPFGNPVMLDYFGTVSGTPYTYELGLINTYYSNLATYSSSNVLAAMKTLDSAVLSTYYTFAGQFQANVDATAVTSAVAGVVSAVNGVPTSSNLSVCSSAYSTVVSTLSAEVANLAKAGVTFGSAPTQLVLGLAQRIPSLGISDPMGLGMPAILANLITQDAHGDTLRAAIAEFNNVSALGSSGIALNNDPNPQQAISQIQ